MKRGYVILASIACLLSLCSCNGTTAKKTSQVVKKAYNEYRQVSKSDAIRYYKMKNNMIKVESMVNAINVCDQCGGWGIVYMVDENGYYYTDSYGNPLIYKCNQCGGSGKNF